jgi:hypothetical protein
VQTEVFARSPVLRGYWYAVARSSDAAPGPLAVTVLGEPLALWRTADGPSRPSRPGADTMQGTSPITTYPSSLFHNLAVARPPQQGSFTLVPYGSRMRSLHGDELPLL